MQKQIAVSIEGITPLLMNKFTDANAQSVEGGTSAVQLGDKGTPRERAEKKLYVDERGVIHVPLIFYAIFFARGSAGMCARCDGDWRRCQCPVRCNLL